MTDESVARATPTPEQLLEFERAWPAPTGRKNEAIRLTFGLAAAPYYALLIRATETDTALHHDALLSRQIRDRMHRRSAARAHLLRRNHEPITALAIDERQQRAHLASHSDLHERKEHHQ